MGQTATAGVNADVSNLATLVREATHARKAASHCTGMAALWAAAGCAIGPDFHRPAEPAGAV
jgi:hypothetical protein